MSNALLAELPFELGTMSPCPSPEVHADQTRGQWDKQIDSGASAVIKRQRRGVADDNKAPERRKPRFGRVRSQLVRRDEALQDGRMGISTARASCVPDRWKNKHGRFGNIKRPEK